MASKALYCMECVEGRAVALGLCSHCLAGEPVEAVVGQIARLTRELEEARERERGYREALCQALDRGFPGDTHEGDCAVTRGMQCDCWIGQARALAAHPTNRSESDGE